MYNKYNQINVTLRCFKTSLFLSIFTLLTLNPNISAAQSNNINNISKERLNRSFEEKASGKLTNPKARPFPQKIVHNIDEKCGTMHIEEMMHYAHPSVEEFEQWMEEMIQYQKSEATTAAALVQIPVVVHVVHNGETVGGLPNIDLTQIQSQIDVLNEDFRRLNSDSTNTPADFLGITADAEIEFCLANIDPDGVASNGVNRYNGGQSSYSVGEMEIIKAKTIWHPDFYFNIWCAPLEGGLLGYAQFPGMSGLPGLDSMDIGPTGPSYTDGVVVRDFAFGRGGSSMAPFNLGRTATHEVGHFFGLRHMGGDGDCSVDDFCDDTPTQSGQNENIAPCSYPADNDCDDGPGDLPDQFMNFMDYSDDACMNLFTMDQKTRFDVVLAMSPRRASLLTSMVCSGLQPTYPYEPFANAPANDLCAGAEIINCGDAIVGSTLEASPFDIPDLCGTAPEAVGVWYNFTGDGNQVVLSLCGSDYDSKINVYSGTCGGLVCVAGNDDFCDVQSLVSFSSTNGTEYYVYVNGWEGSSGNFTLQMSCESGLPANDLCSDAIPIGCGEVILGSTISATNSDEPATCIETIDAPGVWYSYVGTGDLVRAGTCNAANYDTKISVYSGTCGALVCEAGNDDNIGCGMATSEVQFFSNLGVTYYLYVNGYGSEVGIFNLSIECVAPIENDFCANAIAVSIGDVVAGNTDFATTIGSPLSDCGGGEMGAGLWYRLIGTGEDVLLTTCDNADFDTKIDVFTGDCGSLSCVAGNDDGEDCLGFTSAFELPTDLGVEYYIYVSGYTFSFFGILETGSFELAIEPACPVDNISLDDFYVPPGGLDCQDDGTYFLSLLYETPFGYLPRDIDGFIDFASMTVSINGEDIPVFGGGYDDIVGSLYLEVFAPGDGQITDVTLTVGNCSTEADGLFNAPDCICFTGVGPDIDFCGEIGAAVPLNAVTNGPSGFWTLVQGNGMISDLTNPISSYLPDVADMESEVIISWTTPAFDSCIEVTDELTISFTNVCIPTVSQWGLLVLLLSFLILGVVGLKEVKRIWIVRSLDIKSLH